MSPSILGIDVAKETLDVALIVGERMLTRQFANTSAGYQNLLRWLHQHNIDQVHACLEATGQYGDGVSEFLSSITMSAWSTRLGSNTMATAGCAEIKLIKPMLS